MSFANKTTRKTQADQSRFKPAALVVLLVSLAIGGCQSASHIESILRDADLELPIRDIRASAIWRPDEAARGLEITVLVTTGASRYEPNLKLELDGAARVCAALARSDRILEWAYLDLYYFIYYQNLPGATHQIAGLAEVIMQRETLLNLREQNAPASKYPKHWRFVVGHKDQPGGKPLLSW